MEECKVSLNELVNISSYSVTKDVVPTFDELKKQFSTTWADTYLDEDLKEHVGEPCYIINDDVNNCIRGIYVGDELTDKIKMNLLDNLDNVIFDLIYNDIIEQMKDNEVDDNTVNKLVNNQSYVEMLEWIRTADEFSCITVYDYSWVMVLAENRLDLLEL